MAVKRCVVCDVPFAATGNTKTCQIECRQAYLAYSKREWRKDNPEKVRHASKIGNAKKRQCRLNEKKAEAVQTPLGRVLDRYAKDLSS